ncbi:hypothetical protein ElyMa_002786500 [Elysia marginata]|uniref:Uncharacterized protein n=1 Tax=Elysia marginata TaxID=1093978 RepID=A0AAV4HN99_9GAST|nr:hypothetical protein ElyMa_002786500 [Elysia marginata]
MSITTTADSNTMLTNKVEIWACHVKEAIWTVGGIRLSDPLLFTLQQAIQGGCRKPGDLVVVVIVEVVVVVVVVAVVVVVVVVVVVIVVVVCSCYG